MNLLTDGITSFRNTIAGIISPNRGGIIINDDNVIINGTTISADATLADARKCSTYATTINKLTGAISEVPIIAETKYLTKLFEKPNGWQTGNEFMESASRDYWEKGETFIEMVGSNPKRPMQMIPHDPLFVTVRRNSLGVPEFQIRQDNNRIVPYERMVWVRDISTTSIKRRSRRDSLGLQINVLNATERLANAIMHRGIYLSYILTSPNEINEETRQKNNEMMKHFVDGGKKSGGFAQFEKGQKLEKAPGLTIMEAEILKVREHFMKTITDAHGMPVGLAGGPADVKYNNMAQHIGHMHRNGISPVLSKFVTGFHLQFEEEIKADDHVLQKGDYATQSKTVLAEIAGGLISANEGRIRLGMEPTDNPDDDKLNKPKPGITINGTSDQQTNPEDIEE